MTPRARQRFGWAAVGLSTIAASFWAFWGIIENFYEGWYYRSVLSNVGLLLIQYLSPMIIFIVAALVAIYAPRIGAAIHFVGAMALVSFWWSRHVSGNPVLTLIVSPLLAMSVSYWIGRPEPRRRAAAVVIGLPLLTLCIAGAEPAFRAAQRVDDGNLSARRISQNGVDLIWAPAGPGWPDSGVRWPEAIRRCEYLSEDGYSLAPRPQHIWRLPTVDEVVRSEQLHGTNSGGIWNATLHTASYSRVPDKESPLWNVHSKVIYWWTSTEPDSDRAFVVASNGRVIVHSKNAARGYLAFRAVRNAY